MYKNNAQSVYLENAIMTATPQQLTTMLYDGLIKFCNKAKIFLSNGNIVETNENLIKAQNIVSELMVTANQKHPVYKEIMALYEFVLNRLIQANIKKDIAMIDEALPLIHEMKDTWVESVKIYNQNKK